MDVHKFGPRAALFYLGAWLLKSGDERGDEWHRRYRPRHKEVQAFKDSLEIGAEDEELD